MQATARLTTRTSPCARSPTFRPQHTSRQDDQDASLLRRLTTASTRSHACSISRSNQQPKNQAPPPSRCTTSTHATFTNSTHAFSEQQTQHRCPTSEHNTAGQRQVLCHRAIDLPPNIRTSVLREALTYPLCVWRQRQDSVLDRLSMEQLNEISPDSPRNKPHHASFIYLDMGRGIWQTYVSHHQPQKSADLTIQSGARCLIDLTP